MLALTGIGMVTSLGLDAVGSCAAARAGLQRARELDGLYTMDAGEEEQVPVVGHAVPLIASSFFGFARLVSIAVAGLADLQRSMPRLEEGRLGFVLVAGSPVYREAALESARATPKIDADAEMLDEDAAQLEADVTQLAASEQRITQQLLGTILRQTGLRVDGALAVTLRSTCVGLIPALHQAAEWLEGGACERCIIGAVDSLLDPKTVAALDDLGLVKAGARPVGMLPGEASAFLALELPRAASASRSSVLALVEAPVSAAGASNPLMQVRAVQRRDSFARAIAQTITSAYPGGFSGLLVANLNGDEYRARTWGEALVATRASNDLSDLPTWLPCVAFGETGAAAGSVAITLLARSWARRYAPAANALVCLHDDVGGRGVIAVRAPSN